MCKYNRESPVEAVLCMNHALHLAVVKFFYELNVDESEVEMNEEVLECECDSDSDGDGAVDGDDQIIFEEPLFESYSRKKSNFFEQLEALRAVIKFFRLSSLKNDFLQAKINERLGKELELKKDVKTRWNSIDPMIKRYLEVKGEVKEALEYFNFLHLLDPIDEEYLINIQQILEPVRIAADALARNDATLFSAESVIELLCTTLENYNSPTSLKFLDVLKEAINKRRNIELVSLAKYMLNPKNLSKRNCHFHYCSKSSTVTFAKKLISRLFTPQAEIESNSDDSDEFQNIDLKAQFQKAISTAMDSSKAKGKTPSLQQQFSFFEVSGEKSKTLSLLFEALQSAKPTSTDNERTFSVASRVCTKIRTRLSDENLHIIVFLKYFFLKQKNK